MRIITGTDHYQELRKKIFYPVNELKGASTLQYSNYAKLFGKKKLQKFSEFNIVIIQILTIDTFESKLINRNFHYF